MKRGIKSLLLSISSFEQPIQIMVTVTLTFQRLPSLVHQMISLSTGYVDFGFLIKLLIALKLTSPTSTRSSISVATPLSSSGSTDSSISQPIAPMNYMNYVPNNFGAPQIAHLDLGYSPKTDQQNSSRTIPLQRSISSKVYCPVCDKGDYPSSVMPGNN